MRIINKINKVVPTNGTLELNYSTLGFNRYTLIGSPTLIGDVSIQSDQSLAEKGIEVDIMWDAKDTDLNGNQLIIFGVLMTEKQLSKTTLFTFYYTGTKWIVLENSDNKEGVYDSNNYVIDETIEISDATGLVDLGNLAPNSGKIIKSKGSVTLSSNVSITATGVQNTSVYFILDVDIDLDGNSIEILGEELPSELINRKVLIKAVYTNDEWIVIFNPDYQAPTFTIEDGSISTAKLVNNAVTFAKFQKMPLQSIMIGKGESNNETLEIPLNKILIGGDGELKAVAVSGDAVLSNTGALSITLKPVEGLYRTLSLETGYLGDIKMVVPFACVVKRITAHVDKLIENTDDATVTVKNHIGSEMEELTITKGSAIGQDFSIQPETNNQFTAGQVITFSTSKATPGGQVFISLEVQRTNFNSYIVS